MNKRLLMLAFFVVALLALVAYSKLQHEPLRVSGFVEADEIRLGSRVGGRVAFVHVQEGEEVESGEVLVELEPFDLLEREKEIELTLAGREADYQRFLAGFRAEELAQAKAKVDQLQAEIDLLRAGPREQEIEAGRGRLALAEAEKQLAERSYQRVSQLANAKATSQQELDAAREALDAASANLLVRQQELDLLEEGSRPEELRKAAALLEEA